MRSSPVTRAVSLQMSDHQKFADMGRPRRVWAIGAIHGEDRGLSALHDDLAMRFRPGDRLVYLGNYVGHGPAISATVAELLDFRRRLLAQAGMAADDIIYLRGCQEEMWQKLLQLQFAPDPTAVLSWMLHQGLGATLETYGSSARLALNAARDGAMSLTRWTNGLRRAMREHPGHENLFAALRRAAFTVDADGNGAGLLLVHAGLEPARPLEMQGDAFWWGANTFARLQNAPYGAFTRVVRGYDPLHGGLMVDGYALTLDGGSGFGGRLICACLSPQGDLLDLTEA